jgi:hypothetical protein
LERLARELQRIAILIVLPNAGSLIENLMRLLPDAKAFDISVECSAERLDPVVPLPLEKPA